MSDNDAGRKNFLPAVRIWYDYFILGIAGSGKGLSWGDFSVRGLLCPYLFYMHEIAQFFIPPVNSFFLLDARAGKKFHEKRPDLAFFTNSAMMEVAPPTRDLVVSFR